MTEKSLISKVGKKDEQAFSRIYDLYAKRVYNIALSFVKQPHTAEEITQETFIKIYNGASQFKGNSAVSTWIYRITANTSLNYLKKNKKRIRSHIDVDNDSIWVDKLSPSIIAENKELTKWLYQAIDQLPDNQRIAFTLSYLDELPRQSVADVMDVSLKSIEGLLHRAKKKLRIYLSHIYDQFE